MTDRSKAYPHDLMKVANGAAELLHRETGAPYVLVILAGEEAESPTLIGGWTPGLGVIRRILREALDRIDSGKVSVRDMQERQK